MRNPRRALRRGSESGQVIVLLLVVIAVVAGGWWFFKRNRDMREREAHAYANEIATSVVLQQDARFLDRNLTQKAQLMYPPSWRMRVLDYIRQQGPPPAQFKWTKADVMFVNQFFEPTGHFIAQFDYPPGPAFLEMNVSHPGAFWAIDSLNWTWTPAPTPTPAPIMPAPVLQPSPGPSPSATPSPPSKAPRPKRS
jgi:hypothetical protein